MAEFSNEGYLRALADNGDREAAKEYEQALDNRIFLVANFIDSNE